MLYTNADWMIQTECGQQKRYADTDQQIWNNNNNNNNKNMPNK